MKHLNHTSLFCTWLWVCSLCYLIELGASEDFRLVVPNDDTRISRSNEPQKVQQLCEEVTFRCYEPDFSADFGSYMKMFINLNHTMLMGFNATLQINKPVSISCPTSSQCARNKNVTYNIIASGNSGVITLPSCCEYFIEVFTDICSADPFVVTVTANHICHRAVNFTLQEEWNPSGYYTVTVTINLQFDPLLLQYLHHISISSHISSDNLLIDNTESSTENVPSKPWDDQLYPPYPLIMNFTDGCNRMNPAYNCKEICDALNNGQRNCTEACIDVTSYTYNMERKFYPLSHNDSYKIEVAAVVDELLSYTYACWYTSQSVNFQKSCIPPDPPTNVTILKSSCSSEMCSVLLSWDLPIYVNNETVYFVFIHHDEVNNTLIGENGKYLVEIEQRLSTKVLINNQDGNFTINITFNVFAHDQFYIQVRRNNTCTEGLLGTWSEQVIFVIPRNPPEVSHDQGIETYWFIVIGGCSACLLVVLILMACLSFCCYNQHKDSPIIHEEDILPPAVQKRESSFNVPLSVDDWEIPASQIFMPDSNYIARGNFGEVYKGYLTGSTKRVKQYIIEDKGVPVAVKLLPVNASGTEKEDFLLEIKLYKKVSSGGNPYIVNMLGCCTLQEPLALILEFAPHGNLLNFLRALKQEDNHETQPTYVNDNLPSKPDAATLLKYGFQICSGMEYLCNLNIVHRDLACRNILVGNGYTMKITDFGLSRQLYDDPVYVQLQQSKVPLRWMSIEAIIERKYTFYSDVWSFGVVLWEIFTYGEYPYSTLSDSDLLCALTKGKRLSCPSNCSNIIFCEMMKCWDDDPSKRPLFSELKAKLASILIESSQENNIDNHGLCKEDC